MIDVKSIAVYAVQQNIPLTELKKEIETAYAVEALATHGSQTKAAIKAGINRGTLRKALRRADQKEGE